MTYEEAYAQVLKSNREKLQAEADRRWNGDYAEALLQNAEDLKQDALDLLEGRE